MIPYSQLPYSCTFFCLSIDRQITVTYLTRQSNLFFNSLRPGWYQTSSLDSRPRLHSSSSPSERLSVTARGELKRISGMFDRVSDLNFVHSHVFRTCCKFSSISTIWNCKMHVTQPFPSIGCWLSLVLKLQFEPCLRERVKKILIGEHIPVKNQGSYIYMRVILDLTRAGRCL